MAESICGRRPASIWRKREGAWYRDTGQGMGPALNTASSMKAYLLADRGTSSRSVAGSRDPRRGNKRLYNQYGVILVNPDRHPTVKQVLGANLHRLADLAGRPEGDRRLQDQRGAALLPERGTTGRMRSRLVAIALALSTSAGAMAQEPGVCGVNAAGSLRAVMTELAQAFTSAGGPAVIGTFGASGLLRERIERASPPRSSRPRIWATHRRSRGPAAPCRRSSSRAIDCAPWPRPISSSRPTRCSIGCWIRASSSEPRRRSPIPPATMPGSCSKRRTGFVRAPTPCWMPRRCS